MEPYLTGRMVMAETEGVDEAVAAADARIREHVLGKGARGSGVAEDARVADGATAGEGVAEDANVADGATDGEGVAENARVADGATAGEGVAEDARVADGATDEHLLTEKDTPDWTPEQREYLDKKFRDRLGPYVRRAKEAEERVRALEAQAAEAGALKDAEWRRAIAARGIPPELVTKAEGETVSRYEELRRQQAWYRKHFSSGYTASGRGEDTVSLDQGEVQEGYLKVTEELMELAPRAGAVRERVEKELLARYRGAPKGAPAVKAEEAKRVTLPKPPQIPVRRGAGPGQPATGKRAADDGTFDARKAGEGEDVGAALEAETRRLVLRRLGKQ